MIVVGIAGKIGAGKDAVAARLVQRWGFTIVRMADALKDEVVARFPLTLRAIFHATYGQPWRQPTTAELRHEVRVTKPPIIRELLQEFGTEVRRADDPDYWVKRWAEAATIFPRVVVPDVRFPNEAAAVLAQGGVCWRVTRPGYTVPGAHVSETALDAWDGFRVQLANVGSLEDLGHLVDQAVGPVLMDAAA